jgi:excisionase family DNA binding protein
MTRDLYPVEEAADRLGVRRTKLYQLINRGAVKRVYIDGKPLITASSISQYVRSLEESAGAVA